MLPQWLMALLVLLKERWSTRRDGHVRFLKLQVEILRTRLPGSRIIPDRVERRRLLKAGAEVDHAVEDTLGIVSIKTYRRWQREEKAGKAPKKVGRPRTIPQSLRDLIIRLARENVGWGVRRIVGELKKLAVKSSRSSVRRVLVEEDILPDPDRHAPKGVQTPWQKFIAMHMNVMVACDFFCKTVSATTPAKRPERARACRNQAGIRSGLWSRTRLPSSRSRAGPKLSSLRRRARPRSQA